MSSLNDSISKETIAQVNVNEGTSQLISPLPQGSKVAVIGAGPAGLSCAYELLRLGYKVDIFELDNVVGGMSRTIDVLGQRVDIGPHRFFSKYDLINNIWQLANNDEFITENRLSRIFYRGKFFSYPLKGFEALFNLGLIESTHCILSYLYSTMFPRKEHTFEAWVSNAFGHRLYEIFFKTYSEKLWGIKCTELSDLFAKQRIKSLNLMGAIKNALRLDAKGNTPISLIDKFQYPKNGTGIVYDNLAQIISDAGGKFIMQEKVIKILTENHKATGLVSCKLKTAQGNTMTNGTVDFEGQPITRQYDCIVSSAVFTEMLSSMDELSEDSHKLANELTFRNTSLVFLKIDPELAKLCPDHWLYIHSPEIQTGRISDAANWSIFMQNGQKEHIICFEYWANDNEPLWLSDDTKLIETASTDAVKTGFISKESIKEGFVHRISKSYPIYHTRYSQVMELLIKELNQFSNLYFIGRNGSARYNNMDHSIFMGLMCARKIAGQYDGSLWDINTDSNYQEIMDKHDHSQN